MTACPHGESFQLNSPCAFHAPACQQYGAYCDLTDLARLTCHCKIGFCAVPGGARACYEAQRTSAPTPAGSYPDPSMYDDDGSAVPGTGGAGAATAGDGMGPIVVFVCTLVGGTLLWLCLGAARRRRLAAQSSVGELPGRSSSSSSSSSCSSCAVLAARLEHALRACCSGAVGAGNGGSSGGGSDGSEAVGLEMVGGKAVRGDTDGAGGGSGSSGGGGLEPDSKGKGERGDTASASMTGRANPLNLARDVGSSPKASSSVSSGGGKGESGGSRLAQLTRSVKKKVAARVERREERRAERRGGSAAKAAQREQRTGLMGSGGSDDGGDGGGGDEDDDVPLGVSAMAAVSGAAAARDDGDFAILPVGKAGSGAARLSSTQFEQLWARGTARCTGGALTAQALVFAPEAPLGAGGEGSIGAISAALKAAGIVLIADGSDGRAAKWYFYAFVAEAKRGVGVAVALGGLECSVPVQPGRAFKLSSTVAALDGGGAHARGDAMAAWFLHYVRESIAFLELLPECEELFD